MSLKNKTIATWLLNTNSNSTVGGNNGADTAVTYNGDSASFLRSTNSRILIADSTVFTFGTSNFEILVESMVAPDEININKLYTLDVSV